MNESAALAKLIVPSTNNETVETTIAPNTIPLKVRPNNPFKKRKDDVHSDQIGSKTKQVSNAAEVEISDTSNVSPSNIKPKVNKVPSRKRKNDIILEHVESIGEEVSVVTEIESSDILCVTPESQESVNSKLPKGKRIVKNEKLKRSSFKSSGNKNSSILNFFSRV